MAEYKEAFFETGGIKADWADRTMNLYIDYDVNISAMMFSLWA